MSPSSPWLSYSFQRAFLLLFFSSLVETYRLDAGQLFVPLSRLPFPQTASPQALRKSILDLPSVEQWATERQLKPIHLPKIYRLLFKASNPVNNDLSSYELTQVGFPQKLAEEFVATFSICLARIIDEEVSVNGGRKLVIQLSSGRCVETVLIFHPNHVSPHKSRHTVCVSSQVGCAKACSFCETGTMGLHAQLSSSEILEQVWLCRELVKSLKIADLTGTGNGFSSANAPCDNASSNIKESFSEDIFQALDSQLKEEGPDFVDNQSVETTPKLRNVVFMGMGEPLDNYKNVHEAIRGLTHQFLFGFGARHVTISTVGASALRIKQVADDLPGVSLALSLHSATQALREKLMPSSKGCHIDKLREAIDYYSLKTGRGVMLEYLLIQDVNDSESDCDELGKFCQKRTYERLLKWQQSRGFIRHKSDIKSKGAIDGVKTVSQKGEIKSSPDSILPAPEPDFVNLIPYNPTSAGSRFGYETSSIERIKSFSKKLVDQYGVRSMVRWSSAEGRDTNGACGQLALSVKGKYPTAPRDRSIPKIIAE